MDHEKELGREVLETANSEYESDSDGDISSSSFYFNWNSDGESDCEEQYLPALRAPAPVHPPTILHWVRMSSLRCHDNKALMHAVTNPDMNFRAVFVIDPWFLAKTGKMAVNRLRFLLESLHDLDQQLRIFNTRLYVAQGQPVAALDKLCKEWNVSEITFQIDREIRADVLERAVESLAESNGIKVTKYEGHTLYNVKNLLQHAGKPIMTMKDFREVLPLVGPPLTPIETLQMPASKPVTHDATPNEYRIPTLQQLGVQEHEKLYSNTSWVGGESVALRKLVTYCTARKQPYKNQVDMLFDNTALSPYIRFGCLSVRYFLWKVKEIASHDPSFETLFKELSAKLLTREFYITVASQVPNFDCYNNSVSLHLPWEEDSDLTTLWKEGKTGFPWIDAAMRQLQQEGFIHNCLRESVATFLTRGDLWMQWVRGKDVFEELLLDFEPSVSCGCWMKSSCSAFFTGPVEHYCPMTYGQRIDPTGLYIRTYVPELKNFPSEYIYTPWMAPVEVQKAAGCQIGVHYPTPIVDHTITGALCCEKLRSVMNMFSTQSGAQTCPLNPSHHQFKEMQQPHRSNVAKGHSSQNHIQRLVSIPSLQSHHSLTFQQQVTLQHPIAISTYQQLISSSRNETITTPYTHSSPKFASKISS